MGLELTQVIHHIDITDRWPTDGATKVGVLQRFSDGRIAITALFHSAYYNDNIFLKHRKVAWGQLGAAPSISSAGDSRWMSTGICRSNGRYRIREPSSGRFIL
jgi:hypothetical protein